MRRFTMRQARLMAGLKQQEVADKLGLSLNGYRNIENYESKFRVDTAYQFAEIVGLDIKEVIFFRDDCNLIAL
ncbi:conserved hypothetical protein [Exiguobacterium sp. 8H]|uniref:helix-turn-helix transcriptional regulator n=1 Tax=unclassified Exiguobacterium TaxID=2644629 RepID=UPI0012F00998|nr:MULTISPECIES: helix-turn-helix transcriptional regulator [unclassified Exiguobacterium]VXB53018.1 conserved hypothetical protein [Exiguobacterium sp. 8A]VXB53689.1 conserved hypothetical protein [Exiguobacterium sp. 8H]